VLFNAIERLHTYCMVVRRPSSSQCPRVVTQVVDGSTAGKGMPQQRSLMLIRKADHAYQSNTVCSVSAK